MKKNILITIVVSAMFIISCRSVQLFEISSQNLDNSGSYFEFENDSLRIIYNFFSEGGTMSFFIINKLKVPLYIDWRKSSFILNGSKNNYWTDIIESNTIGRNINLSNPKNNNVWSLTNIGLSEYSTISEKPERITFIPPATAIPKYKFKIYPKSNYSFERNSTFQKQKKDDKNNFKIEFETYTNDKSPIRFRNFLTFSTTEKFDSEFYIDNSFFVYGVKQFMSNHLDKIKSPKSFYIYHDFSEEYQRGYKEMGKQK